MVNLKDICLTTYIKIPFLIDQLQLGAGRIFIIANISVKQMSYTIPVSSQKPTATTDETTGANPKRQHTTVAINVFSETEGKYPQIDISLHPHSASQKKPNKSSRTED